MRVVARSDAGLVREVNEDFVVVDEALGLIMVADGQGGVVTGVLAARLAVEGLRRAVASSRQPRDPEQCIHQALVAVDQMIFDAAQSEGRTLDASIVEVLDDDARDILEMVRANRGTLDGMHAAVVLAMRSDGEFVVAQVGHCRAYRVFRGVATPIFTIQPRLRAAANVVGGGKVASDIVRLRLHQDERLVLCSDGLHDVVNDTVLADLAARDSLDAAVDGLIQQAKPTSTDNIALAILEVGGEPLASWRNAPPYQKR
jgi:protein phosphatase